MTEAPVGEMGVAGGKAAARRFFFGPAILDERTLELLVSGQPAELEPKPLEVLRHLLAHAGEVVTKDEILGAVWPGRILSETVLTKCIARLRDVLRDDGQQIIKTVHGYGYRLVAPVRVESAAPAPVARFDFTPGDHPPLRPLWSLEKSLGQGTHGEVWLVRHDKTREARVYKFAADAAALQALKREITLYRLLHDALADAAPCIQALDWNLEQPPYFLETEYAPAGSLLDWARARNGLSHVPLSTRLEVAAQAAEGLAAAHSMGVLHKDLKPSNILVVSPPDAPVSIKLGDFGSGGVLDEGRLEAMGITRMGFTRTIKAGAEGGTPLYLAPELIAGQPATVQADIYALGVILYQLIVGDLWRPLAPGWELDIDDELLREDIAYAVEGHVERRLGTALALAQRLRNLDQRREQRAVERVARSEAQAQQLEMERMRARRGWVRATIAVLVAGLVASASLSVVALRARNDAAESAATSKAVSDFLSQDMFAAVNSGQRPLRELTIKDLLDSATAQVDHRFADHPETAARVYAALGASYTAMELAEGARTAQDRALELFEATEGRGSESAMDLAGQLIFVKYAVGELDSSVRYYEDVLAAGIPRLGARHPKVLRLQMNLARGHDWLGRWVQAEREFRAVIDMARSTTPPSEGLAREAENGLGATLVRLGKYAEAEELLRECLRRDVSAETGETLSHAMLRRTLADLLTATGRYGEAEAELVAAMSVARRWVSVETSGYLYSIRLSDGDLKLEQGQFAAATDLMEQLLHDATSEQGPEMDQTARIRLVLAEGRLGLGQLERAVVILQQALALSEATHGPAHPWTGRIRVALADAYRRMNRHADAEPLLRSADSAFQDLPDDHPYRGYLYQVRGLNWLDQGESKRARQELNRAVHAFRARLGPEHRRSRQAREVLARAEGTS